ncbi:MAG: hypothetical protein HGB34_04505 [Candidatus Moranbacteria bacterium]|nr:hypothetical protein [Candidatus Moranbacteria bacterium]NTW76125.1 hypothetical protein [Candidatus Moranbacteria bacterium]
MSTIIGPNESAIAALITELRNAYPELSQDEANVSLITDQNNETDGARFVLRSIIQFNEKTGEIPYGQKVVLCLRFTGFGKTAYLDLVSLDSLMTVNPRYGPRHLDIVREHAKRIGVWPTISNETRPSDETYTVPFIVAGGTARMTYPEGYAKGYQAFGGESIDFGQNIFGFSLYEIAQEVFFRCNSTLRKTRSHPGGQRFIEKMFSLMESNNGESFYDILLEGNHFGNHHSWKLGIIRLLDRQ